MRPPPTKGFLPSAISGCSPETWLMRVTEHQIFQNKLLCDVADLAPPRTQGYRVVAVYSTGCPRRGASRRGNSSTLRSWTSRIGVKVP